MTTNVQVGSWGVPHLEPTMEAQRRVFRRVLECCAEAGDKVLTVHSTRAVKPVLDLIEACLHPDGGRVVLHWFGGRRSEARRALALGCFFSVNATMLANDRGRALVASLPPDRLLTETDRPFTQGRDGPAHPEDVELAVEAIAGLRGSAADEVRNGMVRTLRNLLAIA